MLAQVQETSVQCTEAVSHMRMGEVSFQEVTPRGRIKGRLTRTEESFLKLPVLSSEAHRFPVPITLKTTGQSYMLTYINHAPMTDIF